jgi:hypothetical protein
MEKEDASGLKLYYDVGRLFLRETYILKLTTYHKHEVLYEMQ